MRSFRRSLCEQLGKFFLRLARFLLIQSSATHRWSMDELASLVLRDEHRAQEQQQHMVQSIHRMGHTMVREVMVPRTEMVLLRSHASLEQAIQLITEKRKSRVPLYEHRIDNIVGILYAKDILIALGERKGKSIISVEKLMRKPLFIPETKNVYEFLQELRTKKTHIAIVIDEYGGTSGLVTLEDLIEEIIGEVHDEYDIERPRLTPLKDGYEVDARFGIDELNAQLHLALPTDEHYDTVGGLITSRIGRIPHPKEHIECAGVRLVVTQADARRIERVHIIPRQLNAVRIPGRDT